MANKDPIIIKRITKGGHGGGHGGAWKVAYADFVTAMMCFFLVMWLMGSDDETKASISSYFNNPNPTSPWRPELKDNESIPLGNMTGAGDSVLRGAKIPENITKDPITVVCNSKESKEDQAKVLAADTISGFDSIIFKIPEKELFDHQSIDLMNEAPSVKRLSVIGKITATMNGTLQIRAVTHSNESREYDSKMTRLATVQRFIVDHYWMPEEAISLSLKEGSYEKKEHNLNENPTIELVFKPAL